MGTSASSGEIILQGEFGDVLGKVAAAVGNAGFKVDSVDPSTGVIAGRTSMTVMTWGEKIVVNVGQRAPGQVVVQANSALKFGLVDWGKNNKNVAKLVAAISAAAPPG